MNQCSSTSDCYKASFQYKMDKTLGKTTPGETKLQWLTTSTVSSAPQSVKSPDLGTQFDGTG